MNKKFLFALTCLALSTIACADATLTDCPSVELMKEKAKFPIAFALSTPGSWGLASEVFEHHGFAWRIVFLTGHSIPAQTADVALVLGQKYFDEHATLNQPFFDKGFLNTCFYTDWEKSDYQVTAVNIINV